MIFLISIAAFTTGVVRNVYWEYVELKEQGASSYFSTSANYFQTALVFSSLWLSFWTFRFALMAHATPDPANLVEEREYLIYLKNMMVFAITITSILLMIEVPNQIKIFDYFSPFYQALLATFSDAAQVLIMLLIVVFAQMWCFWVIDQDQP